MHRAFTLAALLIVPTVELSAQRGSSSQDSDSTESAVVKGVALAGSVGFSLLRLALHRNDGGAPAQRFCYLDCSSVRQAAALELSAGPTPFRLRDVDGQTIANAARSLGEQLGNSARVSNRRGAPVVNETVKPGDDLFEYVEPTSGQKGLTPITPSDLNYDPSGNEPWKTGTDAGCALHTCTSDVPLPGAPETNNGIEPPDYGTWNPPNWSNNGPALSEGPLPVLVNPEPGTWALLAAGIGGLALVRRRRR